MIPRRCLACGADFLATRHDVKRGYGLYCSRSCANGGKHNPRWKGGISVQAYRYKRIQKARFPEKIRARNLVRHALKRGTLIRLPCSICGDTNSFAHHHDYSQPLQVEWLCRKHHQSVHGVVAR